MPGQRAMRPSADRISRVSHPVPYTSASLPIELGVPDMVNSVVELQLEQSVVSAFGGE